jgi:MATE family multidrug resistance protein
LVELTDLPDDPPRLLTLVPEPALVRRILYLGGFVMLAMVSQYMVNAADNLMVGRLDPEQATASQAALGVGLPLYWAVGGFFAAVSYGTQAMTARRFAEKNEDRAGQVLFNSLAVAVVAGILGVCIGYFLSPFAVEYLAEASAEQKRLATSYVQLRALGIGAMVVTFSYKAFFDGIGRTYVHLIAALFMNFFNLGLNYLLIFGNESLEIPQLGLDGAGWASMIATWMGMVIMIAVSFRPRYGKRFRFYRPKHLDWKVAGNILRLMLPSGSASLILMGGFLMFMKFVGQIDAATPGGANTYSAATKALMDTGAMCFMPLLALGTATATAVSQSLGAGKPNLAARYGWSTVRMCLWVIGIVMVVLWIFPEEIIALWSPRDPAVPAAAATSVRLVVTSLPMMVVGLILSQALYGAGANLYVMIAEGLLHLGVLVPLSWLLGPKLGFGLEGVWAAAVVYVYGLGLAMGIKFLGRGWRKIQL